MKRLFQKEEKVTEDMNDELQKNDVFPSQTSTGEKKKVNTVPQSISQIQLIQASH